VVVEQIIRPTGLLEPIVEVRPASGQVDDLLEEIRKRVEANERVLVTTLTKRMAEDLTEYYHELGIKVRYLHADIQTVERTEILRDLRAGVFHVLIGINLLREGLDLPEVSLVAILDADKEGFLRNRTSLVQTCGRAARNAEGRVILYADSETDSIRVAVEEMRRRREIQEAYNRTHNITPQTIRKEIQSILGSITQHDYVDVAGVAEKGSVKYGKRKSPAKSLDQLRAEMLEAAEILEFERAASLRDQIIALERQTLEL